jgi:hypothetical protein
MRRKRREIPPCNLVANRINISLGVEMFSKANNSEPQDRHDTDVERKHRLALFVPGNHRDVVTFGWESGGYQASRFGGGLSKIVIIRWGRRLRLGMTLCCRRRARR